MSPNNIAASTPKLTVPLDANTNAASAVAQLVVQLFFFLHLGRGQDAGWNISIFVFAILIISILMIGTLWIMHNLAHLHILTPSGTNLYERGVVAPENELH